MAKRKKEHEAETQTWHEEKQQLQTRMDDALQQLQTVDDALQQLQTQADDALQQARAMLPQRVADLYRAKVPNRLERIMDEFEAAYPKAMERREGGGGFVGFEPKHGAAVPLQPAKKDGKCLDFVFFGDVKTYICRL